MHPLCAVLNCEMMNELLIHDKQFIQQHALAP